MANIDPYLSEIKSAIYGEDVRNSIVEGLKAMNTQNNTLETDVKTTTKNTLDNLRVYKQVNELPLVGDPQLIYCLSDIVTTDSDSEVCGDDPSSTGAQKWDADQHTSYFTNSTARIGVEGLYDYIDEDITKPVMARYYISGTPKVHYTNPDNPYAEGDYPLYSLTLSTITIPYEFKDRQNYTISGNVTALVVVEGEFEGLHPDNRGGTGRIELQLDEFIYDAATKEWKYNRTLSKTLEYRNISNIYASRGNYSRYINYHEYTSNINITRILAIGALPIQAYTNEGYIKISGSTFANPMLYVATFESQCARLVTDQYGYDTYNHSKRNIVEVHSEGVYENPPGTVAYDMALAIYDDESSSRDFPIAPNIWKVIISSSDRAYMYIWNQALERYIELVGGSRLSPPAEDGTYVMKCTVSDGVATYAWAAET